MKTYDEFLELLPGKTFVPTIRGSDLRLIPSEENPCEVCAEAEYNKLCQHAEHCAALKFHTLSKMPSMVRNFFTKEDE